MIYCKYKILCNNIQKCVESNNEKDIIYYYTKIGYYLYHQKHIPLYEKTQIIHMIQMNIKKYRKIELPLIIV